MSERECGVPITVELSNGRVRSGLCDLDPRHDGPHGRLEFSLEQALLDLQAKNKDGKSRD